MTEDATTMMTDMQATVNASRAEQNIIESVNPDLRWLITHRAL